MFTPRERADLSHYVYFTHNPETGEVYVGKGSDDRVWRHKRNDSFILRHGMDGETAKLVEAAAIDLIMFLSLNQPVDRKSRDWHANRKWGDYSPERGLWNFRGLTVQGPWGGPCEEISKGRG